MDDMFKVDKSKTPEEYNYTYYTIFGSHEDLDNDGNPLIQDKKKCLAYIRHGNEDEHFYLKVGTYGKIFNPIGLYSEGRQNKFLSKIGKEEYSFTRVNSKVFSMYLNFLRTKNMAWLNNAERELS